MGQLYFRRIEPSADYGGTRSPPTLGLYLGFTLESGAHGLFAGIVGRIHICDRKRALTVYLHDGLL